MALEEVAPKGVTKTLTVNTLRGDEFELEVPADARTEIKAPDILRIWSTPEGEIGSFGGVYRYIVNNKVAVKKTTR